MSSSETPAATLCHPSGPSWPRGSLSECGEGPVWAVGHARGLSLLLATIVPWVLWKVMIASAMPVISKGICERRACQLEPHFCGEERFRGLGAFQWRIIAHFVLCFCGGGSCVACRRRRCHITSWLRTNVTGRYPTRDFTPRREFSILLFGVECVVLWCNVVLCYSFLFEYIKHELKKTISL